MDAAHQLDAFRLSSDGFQIFRNVQPVGSIESLKAATAAVIAGEPVEPYGVRSIAERCPEVGQLLQESAIRAIVDTAIPEPWRLVRSIFFDKVPGANWRVGWHQDVTIAVREPPCRELTGFNGWTRKDGVPHVQAPAELLEKMVTLRIHLDAAGVENGPLRVIPGTHENRFDSEQIREQIASGPQIECVVKAGDVLAMRPMLLHASHKADSPEHRRVIHLEFGPVNGLPAELEWAAS